MTPHETCRPSLVELGSFSTSFQLTESAYMLDTKVPITITATLVIRDPNTISRERNITLIDHVLAEAGNASLMTPSLRHTLCDHAAGNYRILATLAAELLAVAAQRELPLLDEKLYLEVFAPSDRAPSRRTGASR